MSLSRTTLFSGALKSPHVTRLQLTLGEISYERVQLVVADLGAAGCWYGPEPTRYPLGHFTVKTSSMRSCPSMLASSALPSAHANSSTGSKPPRTRPSPSAAAFVVYGSSPMHPLIWHGAPEGGCKLQLHCEFLRDTQKKESERARTHTRESACERESESGDAICLRM